MNSNFAILKKQKLFSIRVNELFEPVVLRKKGDRFLLFLKAFFWETDLWVTLGDFTVKKQKYWEGKSVFNWKSIKLNEMYCAADNSNYMCHTYAKEFLDSNFN